MVHMFIGNASHVHWFTCSLVHMFIDNALARIFNNLSQWRSHYLWGHISQDITFSGKSHVSITLISPRKSMVSEYPWNLMPMKSMSFLLGYPWYPSILEIWYLPLRITLISKYPWNLIPMTGWAGWASWAGWAGWAGWVGWANLTEKLMFALLTKKSIRWLEKSNMGHL